MQQIQKPLTLKREKKPMNKNELVDAMAAKTGSTKADAGRAVTALTEIIADALKKGDSISLIGFGTFEMRDRAARTGRNPKTGEELKIAAARVPAFKPGATLKATVNNG
nr:HU family DNA-binding protein [Nitrosovibrio sp. Nv6]